jgi:hypothetical protein
VWNNKEKYQNQFASRTVQQDGQYKKTHQHNTMECVSAGPADTSLLVKEKQIRLNEMPNYDRNTGAILLTAFIQKTVSVHAMTVTP